MTTSLERSSATRTPAAGAAPSPVAATLVVYRQQLARARVSRAPLLFVAALQSVGILVLLRGVVDSDNLTVRTQVVAGSTVLVVAFVALNLLAQRFGQLKASGGLDYYGALPVPSPAVVLGTAASYATFAIPGTAVTAVLGTLMYQLPMSRLWMLLPVAVLAGAALAGLGCLFGLLASRPEVATLAGQLGMSVVLFLSIIPGTRFPELLRPLRAAVPSTYAADAFASSLRPHVHWAAVGAGLAGCLAVAVASLALSAYVLRRTRR